jgi:hypothetical protein
MGRRIYISGVALMADAPRTMHLSLSIQVRWGLLLALGGIGSRGGPWNIRVYGSGDLLLYGRGFVRVGGRSG